jgi:hypothetical protein
MRKAISDELLVFTVVIFFNFNFKQSVCVFQRGPDGKMVTAGGMDGQNAGPLNSSATIKPIPPGVLNRQWSYVSCQNFPPMVSITDILSFFQGYRYCSSL